MIIVFNFQLLSSLDIKDYTKFEKCLIFLDTRLLNQLKKKKSKLIYLKDNRMAILYSI